MTKAEDALRLRRSAGRAGFTLIEVMIAMVIMSVGLFAVIHLQVVTVRGTAYAKERNEAMRIATGVANELRTRALVWQDMRGTSADPEIGVLTAATGLTLVDAPAEGTCLNDADSMFSVKSYLGRIVAPEDAFLSSTPVNVLGRGPSNAAGFLSTGAIYRVHYTAYQVAIGNQMALQISRMVLVQVFVSWDNKDHGLQDQPWNDLENNYWDRHIVAVSFFLYKVRNF